MLLVLQHPATRACRCRCRRRRSGGVLPPACTPALQGQSLRMACQLRLRRRARTSPRSLTWQRRLQWLRHLRSAAGRWHHLMVSNCCCELDMMICARHKCVGVHAQKQVDVQKFAMCRTCGAVPQQARCAACRCSRPPCTCQAGHHLPNAVPHTVQASTPWLSALICRHRTDSCKCMHSVAQEPADLHPHHRHQHSCSNTLD